MRKEDLERVMESDDFKRQVAWVNDWDDTDAERKLLADKLLAERTRAWQRRHWQRRKSGSKRCRPIWCVARNSSMSSGALIVPSSNGLPTVKTAWTFTARRVWWPTKSTSWKTSGLTWKRVGASR